MSEGNNSGNIDLTSDQFQSVRRSKRCKKIKTYSEDFMTNVNGKRTLNIHAKIVSPRYTHYDCVSLMNGKDFTILYLQKNGFLTPLLFKDKTSLDLHVPDQNFSVHDVQKYVGPNRVLDVMDVKTQNNVEMTMKEWTKYYYDPSKTKLLNVISLEFSHTMLDNFVKCPKIVEILDWVNCVWPKHLKESQTESTNALNNMMYPKVQKYCLMSVKGCFTDFHIDFGGTSVWYHIVKGSKVFWLIPPTDENFKLFEQWILSGNQDEVFFGDIVEQCCRVLLTAGDTFFLPSGWIHGVYTKEDSIVFGGNFLHSFGMENQICVAKIEETIKVNKKFRYPFFTEMLWYALDCYVYCDMGISQLLKIKAQKSTAPIKHVHFTRWEINGLISMIKYLQSLPDVKKNIPPFFNKKELITNVRFLINKHLNDIPNEAISGILILKVEEDKKRIIQVHDVVEDQKVPVKQRFKLQKIEKSSSKRRRVRCKQCDACKQKDCGKCSFCIDMVKFGGPGRAKQSCKTRQCLQPMVPITAACGICSLDGWHRKVALPTQNSIIDTPSSLMECSVCFEIVHPDCLLRQQVFTINGTYNEDLPNSWICPKCYKDGNNFVNKPRHFLARQKILNTPNLSK